MKTDLALPPPQYRKFKTAPSSKRIMIPVFWDHKSEPLVDLHTRGAIVNATIYCSILEWLHKAIHMKRPELLSKVLCCCTTTFDSILPRIHVIWYSVSDEVYWNTLHAVSISSDRWRSTWHVAISKSMSKLGKPSLLGSATSTHLWWSTPNFFSASFDGLIYQWHKCFNNHGEYVRK